MLWYTHIDIFLRQCESVPRCENCRFSKYKRKKKQFRTLFEHLTSFTINRGSTPSFQQGKYDQIKWTSNPKRRIAKPVRRCELGFIFCKGSISQSSEDTRSLPTVTTYTSISILMTVFSVIGNSLVCLAFLRNRRLRTITNFYVLALGITDMFGAVFVLPFSSIASGLRKWPFGFIFCQVNGFLFYIRVLMTVSILALTAINRYFCVVKPRFYSTLFTRKKTFFSIVVVCIFNLITISIVTLITPILFQWQPDYLFCQVTDIGFLANRALVSTFGIVYLAIPMWLILFCYGSVYRAIRRHTAAVAPSLQEVNGQGTVSAHEIQASRVLLAAVMAFCVCWFPASFVHILERLVPITVPPFWQSFGTLAAGCSPWLKSIIYGIMNRGMRNEFLKLLRCRKEN